jgi:glutaredoxin
MPSPAAQVFVYWIPGCGNCTRLKSYLADRGVEFSAVDVQSDGDAWAALEAVGIRSFPSVRVGERWATGFDLDAVDELLGLSTDPTGRVLSVDELVERSARLLEISADLAEQLPAANYDDPTPTMDQFTAPVFFLRDGSPYVPHNSSKSLVHHIAGHGERFLRFALAADGVHAIGFGMRYPGENPGFGEPEQSAPMFKVADQMRLTALDIRAWRAVSGDVDVTRTLETHFGVQTLHQLLQSMTCSLAQHSRQLVEVIHGLGIDPVRQIDARDVEGLRMPSGIWQ